MTLMGGSTVDNDLSSPAAIGPTDSGEAPDASPENKKAREEGWARWKKLLAAIK